MILPLILHPEIHVDIATARRWYEQVSPGLADEFGRCLAATIDEIYRHPSIYAVIEAQLRRANLHRFPYLVYYRITSRQVVVLGVYHSHTDPEAIAPTGSRPSPPALLRLAKSQQSRRLHAMATKPFFSHENAP